MLHLIAPHYRIRHVTELTPERLAELGLRALLLDVDCTLKRYGDQSPTDDVLRWLDTLRAADIALCLVSNGMGHRIGKTAELLELPFVAKALKPLPRGCKAAIRRLGVSLRETAMVGDQLFADIMAGRFARLTTIYVEPIHPEEEPWFTQLKRGPERWLLRRMDVSSLAKSSQ